MVWSGVVYTNRRLHQKFSQKYTVKNYRTGESNGQTIKVNISAEKSATQY